MRDELKMASDYINTGIKSLISFKKTNKSPRKGIKSEVSIDICTKLTPFGYIYYGN